MSRGRLDGVTVLIAADHADDGPVVAELLRPHGAYVVCVRSAADALRLLEVVSFDALVCDIATPASTMLEVVARIRRDGRWGSTVCIAVTEPESAGALSSELDAAYEKPLDAEKLVTELAARCTSKPRASHSSTVERARGDRTNE